MKNSILFSLKNAICVAFLYSTTLLGQPEDVNGWKEAKWGLTEKQLLKMYDGKLIKGDETLLKITYRFKEDVKIGDYKYRANFVLSGEPKEKKLYKVTLLCDALPKEATLEYKKIKIKMIKKYGKPLYTSSMGTASDPVYEAGWIFPSTHITLNYYAFLNAMNIVYSEAEKEIDDNL